MICDELFKTIDSLNEQYMTVWEDVCNIESPTDYKIGVDAVNKYFIDMAKQHDWKVEVLPQSVSGDAVCITMNPDAYGRPIALSGHTDTVHPLGSFGTPAVKRDDRRIYGPGTTDCKGGIVASFMAMDALERVGFDKRPILLLLQSDEEKSSIPSNKQTINFICEKAKNAEAFLNMEGFRDGEACIERKGIITFRFTVHGVEAHSSNCAKKGANAIAEAAYKIIELEKIKDHDGLTCNCSLISGGTVVNTVPGKCEFYANVRFATNDELSQIRAIVKKIAKTSTVPQCKCDVEELTFRKSMEYSIRNEQLLNRMNEIYAENGLPVLKSVRHNGGSDAADVSAYGIPCVDSLGVYGNYIHSTYEYGRIESLAESAKRVSAVVYCL